MTQLVSLALFLLLGVAVTVPSAQAAESKEQLARAMRDAAVSLEEGLNAAAREGKPISGKFEIGDDGKLQLSIYTAEGNKFSEVIVDHLTGKVAKTEAITGGEDLDAAKSQNKAIGMARLSLPKAVAKAVYVNKGYQAVSAYPSLKDGRPVAEVTLHKGDDWKMVTENLE
jgi:hypothetical protein